MSRIYGGASTFSKMSCNYPEGYPDRAVGAVGQTIITSGGDTYFDTVSALGSQLVSYDINRGMMSLPSIKEEQLADILAERIPCIEMVRYGCNGADATEGAIRYARAHTGKEMVLSLGYHSCQSPFTFCTPPALGCINGGIKKFDSLYEIISYIQAVSIINHNVAAVIIEPVMLDIAVKTDLIMLRRVTEQNNIVLIFDEIITGFRFKDYCVSNYMDVTPDLILLGKGIGGGYPLSIIGGRRDIMDRPVFHSYTFAGFPAAVINAIDIIKIVDDKLDEFWDRSGKFMDDINRLGYSVRLDGYNTRGVWSGDETKKYTLWQHMLTHGYLLGPAFFPRMGWIDQDYERLYYAVRQTMEEIEAGRITLRGEVPVPIFRRNK